MDDNERIVVARYLVRVSYTDEMAVWIATQSRWPFEGQEGILTEYSSRLGEKAAEVIGEAVEDLFEDGGYTEGTEIQTRYVASRPGSVILEIVTEMWPFALILYGGTKGIASIPSTLEGLGKVRDTVLPRLRKLLGKDLADGATRVADPEGPPPPANPVEVDLEVDSDPDDWRSLGTRSVNLELMLLPVGVILKNRGPRDLEGVTVGIYLNFFVGSRRVDPHEIRWRPRKVDLPVDRVVFLPSDSFGRIFKEARLDLAGEAVDVHVIGRGWRTIFRFPE